MRGGAAEIPWRLATIPDVSLPGRRGINPPAESQRMLKQPVPIFHFSLFIKDSCLQAASAFSLGIYPLALIPRR